MPYDLFVSYSRRDNEQGRITQLVERIKTDFASFAKRELVRLTQLDFTYYPQTVIVAIQGLAYAVAYLE